MIFEGCLDSNPEYCRSKLARYRLSHPYLHTYGQSDKVVVRACSPRRPLIFIPTVGYSDYDVFLENNEGSRVYRCKKLF